MLLNTNVHQLMLNENNALAPNRCRHEIVASLFDGRNNSKNCTVIGLRRGDVAQYETKLENLLLKLNRFGFDTLAFIIRMHNFWQTIYFFGVAECVWNCLNSLSEWFTSVAQRLYQFAFLEIVSIVSITYQMATPKPYGNIVSWNMKLVCAHTAKRDATHELLYKSIALYVNCNVYAQWHAMFVCCETCHTFVEEITGLHIVVRVRIWWAVSITICLGAPFTDEQNNKQILN